EVVGVIQGLPDVGLPEYGGAHIEPALVGLLIHRVFSSAIRPRPTTSVASVIMTVRDIEKEWDVAVSGPSNDVWEVMSTARPISRFTDEPVDDVTLARCLEAARWAPSGANAQGWRFVVLRSPEQRAGVAKAAAHALEVIEPVYGLSRPADDDNSRRAPTYP